MQRRDTSRLKRGAVSTILKLLLAAGVALLLWHQFASVNVSMALTLLNRAGISMVFVLVPPLITVMLDSAGLLLCIPRRIPSPGLLRIIPPRIGGDAVILSTPAGMAAGETLRAFWLARLLRMPMEESVAVCLMGKVNLAGGQALFYGIILVVLAVLGSRVTGTLSVGVAFLATIAVGFSLVVIFVARVYTGSRLTSLLALAMRIPWERWKRLLSRFESSVARVDSTILELAGRDRWRVIGSLGAFLGGWIIQGLEPYVILVVLGQSVSVGQGMLLEGVASLLRIGFFFLPSAIGAADAAYASLIAGFGIADWQSVAVAFIVIKRSREILWLGAGYCAILLSRWTRESADIQIT